MNYLELRNGGKLIRFKWNGETGAHEETDVTEFAPRFLWDEVRVTDSTTLGDVFLLLNEHLEVFDLVIGNWCKDFVAEALSREPEEESNLATCDLTWEFTVNYHYQDESKTVFEGKNFPSFGAIGKDGVSYATDFSSTYNMKNVPLRLVQSASVFDEGEYYRKKDYKHPETYTQSFDHVSFTLGDVLYGIIWELSFYGNPAERDKQGDSLKETVKNIDNEEFIPMDDLLEQLKANAEDRE